MSKFFTIVFHTYKTKVTAKPFIITNIITVLLLIIALHIQSIIGLFTTDKIDTIFIVDKDGFLSEQFTQRDENSSLPYNLVDEIDVDQAKQKVLNNEGVGLIHIEQMEPLRVVYYANDFIDQAARNVMHDQLQMMYSQFIFHEAGIDPVILEQASQPISFTPVSLDSETKSDDEMDQAKTIVMIMVIFMFLMVMFFGSLIISDVATEKSSRVMEIIVSSVRPVVHLFAKVTGVALLGLTQIGVIIITIALTVWIQTEAVIGSFINDIGLTKIEPSFILYTFLFFLLGYFLYAIIAAMLGSLVSRTEDSQQLIMPLIFLVMIGYFIAIFGLTKPDVLIVTIGSYIPFFSPMLMLLRIGILDIPLWEIGLSIGILFFSILLFGMLAARVYRGGVLMYGPSQSLKDLKRAITLSKRERS